MKTLRNMVAPAVAGLVLVALATGCAARIDDASSGDGMAANDSCVPVGAVPGGVWEYMCLAEGSVGPSYPDGLSGCTEVSSVQAYGVTVTTVTCPISACTRYQDVDATKCSSGQVAYSCLPSDTPGPTYAPGCTFAGDTDWGSNNTMPVVWCCPGAAQ